jgi:hypothetical protein
MCDPGTLALIGTGISAAVTAAGTYVSSQAASKNAKAISAQNEATTRAQNVAFDQRLTSQSQKADTQYRTYLQEISDQYANQEQVQAARLKALSDQKQIIEAENAQAERLRARGDQAAQDLLTNTSGQALSDSQKNAEANQQALLTGQLDKSGIASPDATDPNAGSDSSNTAYKTRMAEAATNIRNYGSKIAATGSYSQPVNDTNLAITDTKTGIMPAQAADELLRSGAATRLLPAQIAFTQAGDIGSATDQVIRSRAGGALNLADLKSTDDVGLATLKQSDTDTLAANKTTQTKADSDYEKSVGNIISGLGNIGLYGSAYYGGLGKTTDGRAMTSL